MLFKRQFTLVESPLFSSLFLCKVRPYLQTITCGAGFCYWKDQTPLNPNSSTSIS